MYTKIIRISFALLALVTANRLKVTKSLKGQKISENLRIFSLQQQR